MSDLFDRYAPQTVQAPPGAVVMAPITVRPDDVPAPAATPGAVDAPTTANGGPPKAPDLFDRYQMPEPSAGRTAARIVGSGATGFNDAIAGAVGAPVDAAAWLMRKAGVPVGESPIGGSESIKKGIDYVATLPGRIGDAVSQETFAPLTDSRTSRFEPETTAEKTARGVGEGVGNALSVIVPAGAVAGAARSGGLVEGVTNALRSQPVLQSGVAAVGGGVTGATDNPWLGLGASIAVPGAASVVRKTGRAANALVQPFTSSGRDTIVGRTLNEVADNPARSITNMEAYTPPVPGFRQTAAKAANDDSLMATENALNRAGAGFGERANSNNAALTTALDKLDAGGDPKAFVSALSQLDTGAAMRAQAALDALPQAATAEQAGEAIRAALRGRYDALVSSRSRAVDPLYAAARASETPLDMKPVREAVSTAIYENKGDIKKAAKQAGELLQDVNGNLDTSARGTMATRDALGDLIKKAEPGSKEQRVLMLIRDDVDNALAAVPEERAARNAFADMSKPLEPFDAAKGNALTAGVIEKDRFGSNFLLPTERVAGQFFRPGDAGSAAMKEFLRANDGNQQAIDSMRRFISGKAREATDTQSFLRQYGPAIEAIDPALAGQLRDVATTNSLAKGFRASPAGRFVGGDPDAAVRSTLGAPDSAARLQALRTAAGGDPKALAGLHSAIIDDFRRAAFSKVAEDATGNPRLLASGAERWLQANRASLEGILSPEQIAGLDAISTGLRDQARTAVKVAGSDTNRNLATRSIVDGLLWKGAGENTLMSPIRKALGLIYGGANEKTADRLLEVMLDPPVAAALMRKATPETVQNAVSTLNRLSFATAVGSNVDTRRQGGSK